MTSKPVAFLMADLGVTKTHSRPYVSDDNPYSESQFRTMKYRPEFPDRFGCIQDSRAFCQQFFHWYNEEHRHSGIGLLTPAMVHFGQAAAVRENRQKVLDAAYPAHPDRFVRRPPTPPNLPKEVWINKPSKLRRRYSLNSMSECLKMVDTRRPAAQVLTRLSCYLPNVARLIPKQIKR